MNHSIRATSPSDTRDLNERFKLLCLQYVEMLREEGTRVRAFRGPELPLFSALKPEEQGAVIAHLEMALEVFGETRTDGYKLKDSPKLMWRALRKLGWTPCPDIFDKMTDDDVVVVYSPDQKQVFQNLCFFDWVSLTLEDLYAAPWTQYSRRDPEIQRRLHEQGVRLFTGQITGTFDPCLPEHACEEVDTEELLKFSIHIRYISPLKAQGAICGALVVNRCTKPAD